MRPTTISNHPEKGSRNRLLFLSFPSNDLIVSLFPPVPEGDATRWKSAGTWTDRIMKVTARETRSPPKLRWITWAQRKREESVRACLNPEIPGIPSNTYEYEYVSSSKQRIVRVFVNRHVPPIYLSVYIEKRREARITSFRVNWYVGVRHFFRHVFMRVYPRGVPFFSIVIIQQDNYSVDK